MGVTAESQLYAGGQTAAEKFGIRSLDMKINFRRHAVFFQQPDNRIKKLIGDFNIGVVQDSEGVRQNIYFGTYHASGQFQEFSADRFHVRLWILQGR